ncbi:AAEL011908-PA [Aedes aegypti]|uniref:H15 domain-containing protein n=2 Tax=Aedes aegypti TaxID=7159 RepID=Q16NP1_AEDAE|nr:histone H1A, sperm [Aedes aegypti]XP_021712928.1 histone H1A, sperm-like [Aedes aegypti]EAT35971.1 AAEL011908-PA [Aedes aegypti]
MAEVEEKQTEAATGSDEATKKATKEKKPKKARKTKENKEDSSDKEKPKKVYRNVDTPNVHDMIIEALDVLDERKGVTFQAIKRYMEDNYHVDTTKQASHVRKIMAKCVENGDIIRTRGVGCSGRFKVKHSKPTMIKKRLAPEDYQELPNSKKVSKPKPKPEKKEMATPKKATPAKKVSTPASGKKGRPGRKK